MYLTPKRSVPSTPRELDLAHPSFRELTLSSSKRCRLPQVIKSDFILLSGDVVSNLNLEEAVTAHKERRKVSKNAIMTLVVKEDGLGTRLRSVHRSFGDSQSSVVIADTRLMSAS